MENKLCEANNVLKTTHSRNMSVSDVDSEAIAKENDESKITCLKFLESTYSIAIGNENGYITIYRIDDQKEYPTVETAKEINIAQEGAIVDCCPYLTSEGHNILVYATQQGGIHVHDVRVKNDVNIFHTGCQRGLVTRFCMGRDENNYFMATAGGYVLVYDLRFNLITSIRKHTRGAPITDMCTYLPDRITRPHLNESSGELPIPKLLIASSGDVPQIDLYSSNKEAPELSFVVGNPHSLYQSYTPNSLCKEELNYTDINQIILKRLNKGFNVTKDEIKEDKNEASLTRCHFAFKDFHGKMKTMYEANSRIYKILCPRINRNEDSAPFLLSAGADRSVRYWYLGKIGTQFDTKLNNIEMIKKSFIPICPNVRNVEYIVENFDSKILYEREIRNKDKANPAPIPIWQSQNGVSYLKNEENKVSCAGHTDAIVNMELLDFPSVKFLATCGRDNLVKLWT